VSRRRTGDTVVIPGDYQYQATPAGAPAQRFWHQQRFAACLELLAVQPGQRVLDVGCGSGVFTGMVAAIDSSVQVGAVDASQRAVDCARGQLAGRPNGTLQQGLVDDLGFAAESFDRIACLEVVEHLWPEQTAATLADLARLLRPGGRLLLSTPNAHSPWPVIELLVGALGLVPRMTGDQHVASYDPAGLRRLGTAAGLRPAEGGTLFFAAPWLAGLSWRAAERLHRLERQAGRRLPVGLLLLQVFTR